MNVMKNDEISNVFRPALLIEYRDTQDDCSVVVQMKANRNMQVFKVICPKAVDMLRTGWRCLSNINW